MRALVLALLVGCAGREPMGPMIVDAGEIADAGQPDVEPADGGRPDVEIPDACVPDDQDPETWEQATFTRLGWSGNGACATPLVTKLTIFYRLDVPTWVWRYDYLGGAVAGSWADPPGITTIDSMEASGGPQPVTIKAGSSCEPQDCGKPTGHLVCALLVSCAEGEASFGLEAWAE